MLAPVLGTSVRVQGYICMLLTLCVPLTQLQVVAWASRR
jgi:hypothetical protein